MTNELRIVAPVPRVCEPGHAQNIHSSAESRMIGKPSLIWSTEGLPVIREYALLSSAPELWTNFRHGTGLPKHLVTCVSETRS